MLSARHSAGLRVVGMPQWGRCGLGYGPGGAQDQWSATLANRLLGNPDHANVLEGTLYGAELTIDHDCWAVCTGRAITLDWLSANTGEPNADKAPTALSQQRPDGVFRWRAGQRLRLSPTEHTRGLRWYLAISGGIGPDVRDPPSPTDGLAWPTSAWPTIGPAIAKPDATQPTTEVRSEPRPEPTPILWDQRLQWAPRDGVLRVVPGPDFPQLIHALPAGALVIDPRSNGMGLRLNGYAPQLQAAKDAPSVPVCPGIIQASPGGLIICLRDCQTIGGYPRIARLIDCDIDRAAQLRPGDVVRLDMVSAAEAAAATKTQRTILAALSATADPETR